MFVRVLGTGAREQFLWLFSQSTDHRMPVLLALQLATLRLTAFDFRALMFLNVVFVYAAVICMGRLAERYRRHSHFGDLVIPLTLLNFGFSYIGWASGGLFALSVSSIIIFADLFTDAFEHQSYVRGIAAFGALIVCALTGIPGTVLAGGVATVLTIAFYFRALSPGRNVALAGLGASLGVCLVQLALWTPSGAAGLNPAVLPEWLFQFLKASFGIAAFGGAVWRFVVILGLVGAAMVLVIPTVRRWRQASVIEITVPALLLSFLALFFVTAIGRSAHQPWGGYLEMHYGLLVAPIPLVAWIIISRDLPRVASGVIAACLIVTFAAAFKTGAEWRINYVRTEYPIIARIIADMGSNREPRAIANENLSRFYYIDSPDIRSMIAAGIVKLRWIGAPLY